MEKTYIRTSDLFWPLLIASLLLFPALGATPFRRAEIYFADSARAMVERSDWLVPYYRNAPFFDKPALTYWFMAPAFQLFGFSSGTARLASAFAALGVILATIWLGWLLWRDRSTALMSGWILLSTAAFMTFGRMSMSDMLMTLWSTLAMALAVLCYQSKKPFWPLAALGCIAGLGFLTKGPIAVLIPAFGFIYLIWSHRKRGLPLTMPGLLAASGLFALFAFGWFVAVYFRLGLQPLQHFFIRENVERFMADTHDAHRPFWFYAVTFLGEGAPWSFFVPLAVVQFFRQRDDNGKLLLSWMLFVGVFLSLSRGKIDYYLLPLYPAAALMVARYLSTAVWGRFEKIYATVVLVLFGLLLLVLPVLLIGLPSAWRPSSLVMGGIVAAFISAGVGCFWRATRVEPSRVVFPLAFAVSVAFGAANLYILPSFYGAQPNAALVQDVQQERLKRPDVLVAAHDDPTQVHRDLLFYARLPVEVSDDLQQLAKSPKPYLLLAVGAEAQSLMATPGVRVLREYPYLSSKVFSLRGLVQAIEPDQIVLLANFGS